MIYGTFHFLALRNASFISATAESAVEFDLFQFYLHVPRDTYPLMYYDQEYFVFLLAKHVSKVNIKMYGH